MEFRFGQTAIRLTHPDAASLLAAVGARLSARQGFALATLNLDHLVKLGRDAAFRGAYAAQDFVVADGNPVVWMAALGGQRVALVPGSDLVVPLARMAAAKGASVALLGTTEAALSAAAGRLQAEAPGLNVARRIAPPMGFDPDGAEARAILAQLEADRVGLCFLALGAPKQERLADRSRPRSALPRSGRVWIFWQAPRPARRPGRVPLRWSGRGGCCRRRGGWCRAMPLARQSCRGRPGRRGGSGADYLYSISPRRLPRKRPR